MGVLIEHSWGKIRFEDMGIGCLGSHSERSLRGGRSPRNGPTGCDGVATPDKRPDTETFRVGCLIVGGHLDRIRDEISSRKTRHGRSCDPKILPGLGGSQPLVEIDRALCNDPAHNVQSTASHSRKQHVTIARHEPLNVAQARSR